MKYIFGFLLVLLMACNSGNDDGGFTDQDLPNPEKVNPPADAIPKDMDIKNDSVVVPDSAAVNKELNSIRKEDSAAKR